jgi:hypothetical protein
MTHSEKLFAHQIARQNGDGQADIVVNWE